MLSDAVLIAGKIETTNSEMTEKERTSHDE